MSVDLYEHYMEALRRGHRSLAHGDVDEALAAYREAVNLAPDRALPYSGIGNALLRQNALPNALAAFDAALLRAPRDESGLRGRSEALARLGRRADAAASLDLLSDVQEAAGRLADARDSTQRALDFAEQKARRRRLADLTRRVRLAAGDTTAEDALAQTLRPLHAAPTSIEASEVAAAAEAAADGPTAADGAATTAEPEPVQPVEPEPAPDPNVLTIEAERLLDAGDLAGARDHFLAAAVGYEAEGLLPAAIDACYVALAFAPDDAEVHLRLVELYLAAGWTGPAADKLALLGRLTALDHRQSRARARIVILAADHFPDDPRLRRLTAAR
jgi:tetratricopeptide (TPR) repeat protein